jgi:hypothetical protein
MGAAGNRGNPAPKASSFKEVTKLAYSLAVEDSSSIARRGWELSGIGVLTPAQLLWNRKNSTQIDLRLSNADRSQGDRRQLGQLENRTIPRWMPFAVCPHWVPLD